MNKGLKIGLGVIIGILLIVGIPTMSLWSHRNVAISLEEQIEAQETANKSDYDTMWKKFKEETQVTELQAEQIKDVYNDLIQGRNQDTDLLFKVVKEDNPKLDTAVYTKLQKDISSSRDNFSNNQKKIADKIREYNTYIEKKPFMKMITGRQKKDANDYIVTSEKTEDAFSTNKDNDSFSLK